MEARVDCCRYRCSQCAFPAIGQNVEHHEATPYCQALAVSTLPRLPPALPYAIPLPCPALWRGVAVLPPAMGAAMPCRLPLRLPCHRSTPSPAAHRSTARRAALPLPLPALPGSARRAAGCPATARRARAKLDAGHQYRRRSKAQPHADRPGFVQ